MISNGILFLIHVLLAFIVQHVLPAGSVASNSALTSAITTTGGYFVAISDFFPNTAIFAATAAVFVFELFYAGYKVVRWGYQKIPGIT
jgi:hypothetical protein